MSINYQGQEFSAEDDLSVNNLGFWPRLDIQDPKLKEIFEEQFGRIFLGGDELVAYSQSLVSKGRGSKFVEEDILKDIANPDKPDIGKIVFNKTASGIGRGHSLGGLSGVLLEVHGTKMIDSGLTGLVSSRSLVTSGRRRETKTSELVVPSSLLKKPILLDCYLKISKDVASVAGDFKQKFKGIEGIETFNKITPYNGPADLLIVLPLDTIATLDFEVRGDRENPNGNFLPRELWNLSDMFREITQEAGMGIMHNQRKEVARDTYFHYNVFKDPSFSNYALEVAEENGMSLHPFIVDSSKQSTVGFRRELQRLKTLFNESRATSDPVELAERAMKSMLAMREFVGEYNEAVRVKVADSLSWRVWSEQKRHATLRQHVESIYSAAQRAYEQVKDIWPAIERAHDFNGVNVMENVLGDLEKSIVINDKIKRKPELLIPYAYHSARQLMFFGEMLESGIEPRDALYIVPRNTRLRTIENYDLTNLVNMELPLRLCIECEPERYATSWEKRDIIADAVPEIGYFLSPKCNNGLCTERNYCKHITGMRTYNAEIHKGAMKQMRNLFRGKTD